MIHGSQHLLDQNIEGRAATEPLLAAPLGKPEGENVLCTLCRSLRHADIVVRLFPIVLLTGKLFGSFTEFAKPGQSTLPMAGMTQEVP